MSRTSRKRRTLRSLKAVLAILAVFGAGAATAAPQQPHVGEAVACDTAEQASHFASVVKADDIPGALKIVNAAAGKPHACTVAVIGFREGAEAARVRNKYGLWRVVAVTVLAVMTKQGWQSVAPLEQFTLMAVKGVDV